MYDLEIPADVHVDQQTNAVLEEELFDRIEKRKTQ